MTRSGWLLSVTTVAALLLTACGGAAAPGAPLEKSAANTPAAAAPPTTAAAAPPTTAAAPPTTAAAPPTTEAAATTAPAATTAAVATTAPAATSAATAAATTAAAGAATAQCEPDKVATKYPSWAGKTVKIAADPAIQPYVFRDPADFENLIGVDPELAEASMECAGVGYEYSLGSWSGLLPSVLAGQADVMYANLYYTPERAKEVDFAVYMFAGTGALVKKGNPKGITSMDTVCGTTAAAGLGTVEEAAFRDQSTKCTADGKGEITIVSYPDIPGGLRLIQNDRADVLLSDLGIVKKLISDSPNDFDLGFFIKTDFKVGPAVKNGNDELLQILYDGLKVQQEDGRLAAALEKYGIDPALEIPIEILKD